MSGLPTYINNQNHIVLQRNIIIFDLYNIEKLFCTLGHGRTTDNGAFFSSLPVRIFFGIGTSNIFLTLRTPNQKMTAVWV